MKTCKTCSTPKELTEFYAHPQMADGYLNSCKECRSRYQRERSRTPEGRAYDHARLGTAKRKRWLIAYQRKKRAMWPEKNLARDRLNKAILSGTVLRLPCAVCGEQEVHGHHPDYSKPLEVIWLCPTHHRAVHKQYQRKK